MQSDQGEDNNETGVVKFRLAVHTCALTVSASPFTTPACQSAKSATTVCSVEKRWVQYGFRSRATGAAAQSQALKCNRANRHWATICSWLKLLDLSVVNEDRIFSGADHPGCSWRAQKAFPLKSWRRFWVHQGRILPMERHVSFCPTLLRMPGVEVRVRGSNSCKTSGPHGQTVGAVYPTPVDPGLTTY